MTSKQAKDTGTQPVYCPYCNHTYSRNKKASPASYRAALHKHIPDCPAHPMHDLLKAAQAAWHMCQSGLATIAGDHGLITVDLLKEMATSLKAAIAKAEAKS